MHSNAFKINAPHVAAETIDDEVMIVNLDKGNYYSLTGTAAEVWRMIEKGHSTKSIFQHVNDRFRGDAARMQSSLVSFTAELQQEQLIVVDEHPPADPQPFESGVAAANAEQRPEYTEPRLEKYTDMQNLLLIDPIHEVNDEHGWPKLK